MPVKVTGTYRFVYPLVPLQVFALKNITKYDIHRLKTDLYFTYILLLTVAMYVHTCVYM